MKKFYYIHGYKSEVFSREKHFRNALKTEVTQLYYSSKADFKTNLNQLLNVLNKDDENVIIASSLGCFYAIALSSKINCILRLFNPCLNLKTELLKLGCDKKIADSYELDFGKLSADDIKIFASKNDEILPNNLENIKRFFKDDHEIVIIEEKHRVWDFSKYAHAILDFTKYDLCKMSEQEKEDKLRDIKQRIQEFENKTLESCRTCLKLIKRVKDKIFFYEFKSVCYDKNNKLIYANTRSYQDMDFIFNKYPKKIKNRENKLEDKQNYCFYNFNDIDLAEMLKIDKFSSSLKLLIECANETLDLKRFSTRSSEGLNSSDSEAITEILKINNILKKIQKILLKKTCFYENKLKKKLENRLISWYSMSVRIVFYTSDSNYLTSIYEPAQEYYKYKQNYNRHRWFSFYFPDRHKFNICYLFYTLCHSEINDSHDCLNKLLQIGKIRLYLEYSENYK